MSVKMVIPESMSYEDPGQAKISIQELTQTSKVKNAPSSIEDALRVVRHEANLRLNPEYVKKTQAYLHRYQCPPIEFDRILQRKALIDQGFSDNEESLNQY
jgi:hypothetical protein